ncbi:MAG: HEAT repeat domain-containing protein [Acidobacteriota bacterium]|nr:HEAT repeat domain-containing protein [Acidobacteriota bacterium]
MWFKVRSCMFIGLALMIPSLTGVLDAEPESNVSFECSTRPNTTLNEPIVVKMKVRNGLKENINVDLGLDRKSQLTLKIVEPNGISTKPLQFSPHGLATSGKFSIGPEETYSHEILLDEWYRPAQLGTYKVEVSLAKPLLTDNGMKIDAKIAGEVTFRVGPRDEKVLKDRCRQLVDKVLHGQSDGERSEAALTLSYVVDPVAVPYLGNILKDGGDMGYFAVDGLVRIRNAQAVETLRSYLNAANPELKLRIEGGLFEIKTGIPVRVED